MSDTKSNIDWTAARSVALEWNDGHIPASFQPALPSPVPLLTQKTSTTPSAHDNDTCSTCNGKRDSNDNDNSRDQSLSLQQQPQHQRTQQQYLRWYPDYHCLEREAVYCIDNAVKEHLLDAIYNYTTQRAAATGMSTWGTYVTLEQIRQYWNDESKLVGATNTSNMEASLADKAQRDNEEDSLALAIAATFMRQAVVASSSSSISSHGDDVSATKSKVTRLSSSVQSTSIPLWTERDCDLALESSSHDNDNDTTDKCQNGVTAATTAHGVAVWALLSDAPSLVPYHVDYAELIRYETGVIVLPVLAGTVHCSRINVNVTATEVTEAEATTASDESGASLTTNTASFDHGAAACTMSGGEYMVHTTATTNVHSDKLCATTASQRPATPSPLVLDHYKRHGYKSKLSSGAANWDHDNDVKECNDTASAVKSDLDSTTPMTTNDADGGGTWIRIPYRFNRIICQSGHLPHLSTRIHSIHDNASAADSCTSNFSNGTSNPPGTTSMKRVVVGLNVFLHDVGPTVQQAPEHSQAFRERVRRATPLYDNGAANASTSNNRTKHSTSKGGLSLAALTANPRISRLLVQAKREKCRRDLIAAQEALDARIREYLRLEQKSQSSDSTVPTVTVKQVLNVFSPNEEIPSDAVWPRTRSDIHVHLHRQWQKGTLTYITSSELDCRLQLTIVPYTNQRGLVETDWFVGLPR